MSGLSWGLIILLVVLWVVFKLVLGIAGALFHLPLLVAVALALYWLVKAAASRRV